MEKRESRITMRKVVLLVFVIIGMSIMLLTSVASLANG